MFYDDLSRLKKAFQLDADSIFARPTADFRQPNAPKPADGEQIARFQQGIDALLRRVIPLHKPLPDDFRRARPRNRHTRRQHAVQPQARHRVAHLRPLRRRELRRRVQQAHANRRVPRLVPLVLK